MKAHRLEVRRSARWYALGEPGAHTREVWVVLHGYRQLASRFLRRFEPLDDGSRWLVAPEALSRFYVEEQVGRHGPGSLVGGTWMTREDREAEIADYVAYLDRLADVLFERVERTSVRLVVLGFSQGVATAARWTTHGVRPPDALVVWGDTLPPDLDEVRARRVLPALDLVVVRGEADPSRRPAEEAKDDARLEAWGARPWALAHAGGHRVDEAPLRQVAAWLARDRSGGPPLRTPR